MWANVVASFASKIQTDYEHCTSVDRSGLILEFRFLHWTDIANLMKQPLGRFQSLIESLTVFGAENRKNQVFNTDVTTD